MQRSSGRFGLTTLTCVVIANMIGAGLFTTSGYSLAALGSPGRVVIAWCVAGIIAICGAISYSALARRMPVSGGEYLFLARSIHPFFGFLAGWVSLTAGFSGAIAFAAKTFEVYAARGITLPAWLPQGSVAVLAVLVCGGSHAFRIELSARAQNLIVGIKLLAIGLLLLAAASMLRSHEWHWDALAAVPVETVVDGKSDPLPAVPHGVWPVVTAFSQQLVWISLSFLGFNASVYIASEARNARSSVPKSMILGTALVTVLYVILNAVFVSAGPAASLQGQNDIAATAAAALDRDLSLSMFGPRPLERLVIVSVSLAMFSSVAGQMMTGPRVYSQMAQDGLFPRFFRSDNGRHTRAVLLQTGLAAIVVLWASLEQILNYLSTTLALCSVLTVATVFISRKPVFISRKPVFIRRKPFDHKENQSTGSPDLLTAPLTDTVVDNTAGANTADAARVGDGSAGTVACSISTPARMAAAIYIAATLVTIGIKAVGDKWQILGTVMTVATGAVVWFMSSLPRRAAQLAIEESRKTDSSSAVTQDPKCQ